MSQNRPDSHQNSTSTISLKDPELISLGLHLRGLRHSADLTQEELAHRSELHWTYVSQVERGKRNISYKSLRKLARGLDLTPSQVMPDTH